MVGYSGGLRRGSEVPAVAGLIGSSSAAEPEAVMERAREAVVDHPYQIHPLLQGGYLSAQAPSTAHQTMQPRPESRVQPLDVGGVDAAATLRQLNTAPQWK